MGAAATLGGITWKGELMLDDDQRWFHITIGTLNSWLPGDKRGFRSRNHKIHSSGDHRNPPPPDEHAGLHRHARSISGRPIVIPVELRPMIGQQFVNDLLRDRRNLLALSISGMHVHLQVKMPPVNIKEQIGEYKRAASIAVGDHFPGRLWAKGCGIEPIKTHAHQNNVFSYIRDHWHESAWVWTYVEGPLPYPRPHSHSDGNHGTK